MEAQLTQEQVADELGISRQTMSNWENNKTYPDILSFKRKRGKADDKLYGIFGRKHKHRQEQNQFIKDYFDCDVSGNLGLCID